MAVNHLILILDNLTDLVACLPTPQLIFQQSMTDSHCHVMILGETGTVSHGPAWLSDFDKVIKIVILIRDPMLPCLPYNGKTISLHSSFEYERF